MYIKPLVYSILVYFCFAVSAYVVPVERVVNIGADLVFPVSSTPGLICCKYSSPQTALEDAGCSQANDNRLVVWKSSNGKKQSVEISKVTMADAGFYQCKNGQAVETAFNVIVVDGIQFV